MTCKLYRHFNSKNELLYVGISMNVVSRLAGHQNQSIWFDEITKITIENYPNREDALNAEILAIQNELPKYNIKDSLLEYKLNMKENTQILGLKLVAKKINVDVQKLCRMIKRGDFNVAPIAEMTQRRYWRASDVEAFLASRDGASR